MSYQRASDTLRPGLKQVLRRGPQASGADACAMENILR
jgi:hypothetical protein